jgi:hypothetical protein
MTTLYVVMLLSVGAFTATAAALVARLASYRHIDLDLENQEFSASRYEPMARLLDPEEEKYLARQPGATPAAVAAFRRERRRVFRAYLRELAADHAALHAQARRLVAVSPEKSPELVEMLLRQQVRFWTALAAVEVQLALDAVGWSVVNPAGLLETVEGLHAAVRRATTPPGPVRVF